MHSLFVFVVLVVIAWEGLAMATPGENISCHDPTIMTGEVGPTFITFCSKPLELSQYRAGDSFQSKVYWMVSPNKRSAIAMQLQSGPVTRQAVCSIYVESFSLPSPPPPLSLSPSPSTSLADEFYCSSRMIWETWRSPCIKLPDYSQCIAELTSDGNFQIRSDRGVEWSSRTEGKGATQIRVNDEGFIELLNGHNATLWSSSDAQSFPQCSHSFPSFTFHGLPPMLLAILTFLSLP